MIEIRLRPGERRLLASPVGMFLIDDFTGAGPLGKVRAKAERQDDQDPNLWIPLDVEPIVTLSGYLAFPGLNRHPFPVNGEPTRRFRVRFTAEFYRVYPPGTDAYEFEAPAFNDLHPPPAPARLRVTLLPGPTYPFPAEVPVLRGQVVDLATQTPLVDAEVADDNRQSVLTDERGEFALPLRKAQSAGVLGAVIGGIGGAIFPIDVTYGSRVTTVNVSIPAQLGRNLRIELP